MAMGRPQLILRIFLWAILFCFVGFFVYKGVVPSGEATYSYNFEENSRFFSDLRPSDRIEKKDISTLNLIGDPVYFSLYSPRRFDRAELEIKYKTNNTPAVIEAGIMIDKDNWRYELKPIYNKIINQLFLAWESVVDDDVILLQKEKKFDSVEGFLNNLPANEKIAIYNYDLESNYVISDYEGNEEKYEMAISFLGSWQSLIYLKDEDFDVNFKFFDIKEQYDNEEIDVMLFYEEALIATKHLNLKAKNREMSLSALNLPEGVYRMELRSSQNVVTEKIELKQRKIVFPSMINLYNGEKDDFKIFSDSKNIQITIVNPEDLQTILMNDEKVVIDETYRQFELKLEKASSSVDFASLTFENGGFKMSGDGVFSFSEESFFNPRIKKLDRNIDVMGDGIEFVIARYDFPLENDEWRISKAKFDLNSAYREESEYEFMISISGLRADDALDDSLIIDEIKVNFQGKSLRERVQDIFRK